MALNSSGPISLAGTTAGQSIELELGGGGFTMISLNDATVRGLAGVASGAITMPTNFWGKSAGSYWIGYPSNPTTATSFGGAALSPLVLPNGDIIFGQSYQNSSGLLLVKQRLIRITKDGVYVSSCDIAPQIGTGAASTFGDKMILSSSGDSIYLAGGCSRNTSGSRHYCIVYKISTSLSTLEAFSMLCSRGTTTAYECETLTIGSNGNVFAGYKQLGLIQLNPTSLAVVTATNSDGVSYGLTKLSDDSFIGVASPNSVFFKASSAGAFLSKTSYAVSPFVATITSTGYAYDQANNNYIFGNYLNAVSGDAKIVVIDPLTMAFKWAYTITLPEYPSIFNVGYDADGNVYAASQSGAFFCKFNSSGTLLWQRSLKNSTTSGRFYAMTVANDGIYIQFYNGPNLATPNVWLKLPKDGSKTGVYTPIAGVTITYAVTSYSVVSASAPTTTPAAGTIYPPVYYANTPTLAAQSSSVTITAI